MVARTGLYTAGMGDDVPVSEQPTGRDDALALPQHLSALVGALHGPADLGRNHDRYLTYPDRGDVAGGASA
jgi:hypothetical protein